MKLGIIVGGRKIVLKLPSEGDIELDLSRLLADKESASKGPLGPTASAVYRYLLDTFHAQGKVEIDASECCAGARVSPLVFGKALGRLSRNGLITLYRRVRAQSGKVERYEIEILKSDGVEIEDGPILSPWERVLEDIRVETAEPVAVDLFEALCKLADIDGNVVGRSPSDIVEAMDGDLDTFPAGLMTLLVDGKWIEDDDEGTVATIVDFGALVDGGMPYGEWGTS